MLSTKVPAALLILLLVALFHFTPLTGHPTFSGQLESVPDEGDILTNTSPNTRAASIFFRSRRSVTCNRLTGDRLCFSAPFKWRCTCGVMGCVNGQCMCNLYCDDRRRQGQY